MRLPDRSVERLVRAYDALLGSAGMPGVTTGGSAIAAGHGALIEAASLLRGREPGSADEREYVEKRAVAIEELTQVLGEEQVAVSADSRIEVDDGLGGIEPAALLQARQELDAIAGFNSLSRLEELTAEMRTRRGSG
jgi:hypothetical protein